MQKKWYETFFNGVALEFWRRCLTPELTRAEVDFLESVLELPKGGHVLDIPCGNGRHSAELATRGYRVTGVDLASEFVEEARSACPDAQFAEGDMHAIRYENEFDGAFCFGNSFGYAGYQESVAFLAAVGRALKPAGRFAIDTGLAAESILPTRVQQRWMWLGDILYLSQNRYHAEDSRLDIQYTFIRNGKTEVRDASSYIRTLSELRRMLDQAGFDTIECFSSLDRKPYELGSPRLLLVAQKR